MKTIQQLQIYALAELILPKEFILHFGNVNERETWAKAIEAYYLATITNKVPELAKQTLSFRPPLTPPTSTPAPEEEEPEKKPKGKDKEDDYFKDFIPPGFNERQKKVAIAILKNFYWHFENNPEDSPFFEAKERYSYGSIGKVDVFQVKVEYVEVVHGTAEIAFFTNQTVWLLRIEDWWGGKYTITQARREFVKKMGGIISLEKSDCS